MVKIRKETVAKMLIHLRETPHIYSQIQDLMHDLEEDLANHTKEMEEFKNALSEKEKTETPKKINAVQPVKK